MYAAVKKEFLKAILEPILEKEIIKANNDEFVVDWISKEEEQKQYEEVMYEKGLNQGLSEGKKQGLSEGLTKGKELGISEGIEKGIEQNKIENAKKMLELNMDLETISEITNLTKEEIEGLRN